METLTANDFYYLPRVENLKKELSKVQGEKKKLQIEFDHKLDFEMGSCVQLTVLSDKMNTVKELEQALETQIDELTFATLN